MTKKPRQWGEGVERKPYNLAYTKSEHNRLHIASELKEKKAALSDEMWDLFVDAKGKRLSIATISHKTIINPTEISSLLSNGQSNPRMTQALTERIKNSLSVYLEEHHSKKSVKRFEQLFEEMRTLFEYTGKVGRPAAR